MRTDPEPDDHIILLDTQGSPSNANSDSIDWTTLAHQLELKARMERIILPDAVVVSCEALNVPWEVREERAKVCGYMGSQSSSKPISTVLPS